MKAGDILLGLPASGPHSNGFSLIRKVVTLSGLGFHSSAPWDSSLTIGDALLTPTRIYTKQLLPGIKAGLFKGMSHITGGGFTENIPRVFTAKPGLGVLIDCASWELPRMWKWLMKAGGVLPLEMARTFICLASRRRGSRRRRGICDGNGSREIRRGVYRSGTVGCIDVTICWTINSTVISRVFKLYHA